MPGVRQGQPLPLGVAEGGERVSEQTNEQIAAQVLEHILIPPLARSPFVLPNTVRDRIAAAVVAALTEAGRLVPDDAVIVSGPLWRRSVLIDVDRWERVQKAATGWVTDHDYPGDRPGDSLERAGLKPQDLDCPR